MLVKDRIQLIHLAIKNWLRPDNIHLKQAIERTVDEGLFSFQDIKHRILSLRTSLTPDHIERWVTKSRTEGEELAGRSVLCLHAGNLPLVGLQDVLSVLLTGAGYCGKVSSKDPWLLPVFLQEAEDVGLDVRHSSDIGMLKDLNADALLFSGSERSVDGVLQSVQSLNLCTSGAPALIRSAFFSLAWIDNRDPATMKDLTEAVFRYGGRGCRSVAVVVAPFRLDDEKCGFTDYIESFWLHNAQHKKPGGSLYHRFAYNKALGYSQAWLDDFLIEETDMKPEEEFVLHWIQGDIQKVVMLEAAYGQGLQSVYVSREDVNIPGLQRTPELLSNAQTPPIDWKPDGVDAIRWLQENV